jgi:hypothetical protein
MNQSLLLIIKFILFYLILYFLGRVFLLFLMKVKGRENIESLYFFGFRISTFYPLTGLIFLGNILFLVNYIIPIQDNLIFILLLFLTLNLKYKFDIFQLKNQVKYIPLYLILLITSFSNGFHYDAGLYHLNNQLWFRESNIIIGFSNIYSVFGVSSIYEYISSFLWIDRTYLLLHFLNIIFIGIFYEFMIDGIIYHKSRNIRNSFLMLLIYSLLDNFGYGGGRNGFLYIQSIGKQDVAVAVLFVMVTIFILHSLVEKSYKLNEVKLLAFISLFLFQLKVSSVTIFFLFVIYLIMSSKEISFIEVLKGIAPALLIGIFWITKSLLHSGCLVFPLASTCYENFAWVNIDYIKAVQEVSVAYSNSYNFGDSFIEWMKGYLDYNINKNIVFNFLASFTSIIILNLKFYKKRIEGKNNLIIFIFIIINFAFYLSYGPDVRYLMGFQMFLIMLTGFYSSVDIKVNYIVAISIIYLSILLVPRLQNYTSINIIEIIEITPTEQETIDFKGRQYPKSGDQCWANLDCSANREYYYFKDSDSLFKTVLIKSSN